MNKSIGIRKSADSRTTWEPCAALKSGTSFRITPEQLEKILRKGTLEEDFAGFKLKSYETIEQLVFDEQGITVFVGRAVPALSKTAGL